MKYYCINMAQATERRQHCEKEFTKANIPVTFVRGFEGRASQLRHAEDWITCQVGCCISHITLMEEIRHSDAGLSMIFEDDIVLLPDFFAKLQQVITTLPADWQVAAIGWFAGSEQLDFTHINEHWQRHYTGDIWGTGAYLVNGTQGAEAILRCITPIRSHIDRMFWESVRDGRLNGYFLREPLAWQRTDMASQNV